MSAPSIRCDRDVPAYEGRVGGQRREEAISDLRHPALWGGLAKRPVVVGGGPMVEMVTAACARAWPDATMRGACVGQGEGK